MDAFDLRLWNGFAEAGGNMAKPAMIDQIAIDSRRISSPQSLFIPLAGARCDGHQFIEQAAQSGASYALARKGWHGSNLPDHLTLLYVDNTLNAFQAIAQAYRTQLRATIIGITGSYGKTMVKDLLQAMIATTKSVAASPESFNSQIGAALSLFTIHRHHDVALIEAGFSIKGEMDRLSHMIAPDHVILTHIGKKHLTTLGDQGTIAAESIKLARTVPQNQWILLPQDPLLKPHLPQSQTAVHVWNQPSTDLPHATALPTELSGHMMYRVNFPDGTEYLGQTRSGFYYFLDLINMTTKAAWLLGISSDAIRMALSNYKAEPMRTEIWQSPTGITFINDPYCSDPQSVDRALKQFDHAPKQGKKVFVFGGMKGTTLHGEADYRRVGQDINRAKIDLLLLVGQHPFGSLMSEVKMHSPNTKIFLCQNHQEAIDKMRPLVGHNDTVVIKGEKKESLDSLTEAFQDSICTNQCYINLAAIEANISSIRSKLPPNTRLMPMVKALAYGTDDIRIGKFLHTCGIDILGVSYVDEGASLMRAGITQDIFVINAALYEAAKVIKWNLQVGVSEKQLIAALAQEASHHRKQIKVHLHVDTGMRRFGCRPEEALELAQYIKSFPSLILEGIWTHFACADDPASDGFTYEQTAAFDQVIATLSQHGIDVPWHHAANSSGVMRFNFPQYNMARIGLAIYGLYTSPASKKAMDLRLALSLISRIVGLNSCKAGETISYGRSYTVSRDQQKVAVLPIGYFDGLHRNYSGKGTVIIRGMKAPMIGKICMDFMMVDVSDIPNVAIGDPVLIFGEDEHGNYLSPEDLANKGDSIIHELITCLGPRIQRIFIHEEAKDNAAR